MLDKQDVIRLRPAVGDAVEDVELPFFIRLFLYGMAALCLNQVTEPAVKSADHQNEFPFYGPVPDPA